MYIKNQKFKDIDTLFEVLFDFEIGNASAYMQEVVDEISVYIKNDKALQEHVSTLDEEGRLELLDDMQREKTVQILQSKFEAFVVKNACFYGIIDNKDILLYSIELY